MNSKGKKNSYFCVDIKKDKCKECGLCIYYCPSKYLVYSSDLNKRGVKFAKIKKENNCIGCGFCYLICPDSCIEVYEK